MKLTHEQRLLRRPRWYFGGLSSAAAACVTHPLDLIKVLMQTQQKKLSLPAAAAKVYHASGILGFYKGISASLLRQMTYTTTRFALYEVGKDYVNTEGFGGKLILATFAGSVGGIIGVPADVVNVRMQNDVKLPPEKRRNYKHVFHGLWHIYKTEGYAQLFSGASMATIRGCMMTIGQNASYEEVKHLLLKTHYFKDDVLTHSVASVMSAIIATTLTQPLDVMKTRTMNAKPGEFTGMLAIFMHTASLGPRGFFKGYFPALMRIAPHTIILFLMLEQLRLHFGINPPPKPAA